MPQIFRKSHNLKFVSNNSDTNLKFVSNNYKVLIFASFPMESYYVYIHLLG